MCKWGTNTKVELCRVNFWGLTKEQHNKRAKKLGLSKKEELIDACIAPLVQMLNDYGIETIACCCGHGKTAKSSIRISSKNILLSQLGDDLSVGLQFLYKGKQ